ncbi:MAG: hypothetical protein KAH93_05175 [Candidatus Aenigmarchaeota archaeon]|nr:hypothetical protein [Candidatus Aenigmarchaeota archaeon]
MDAFDKAAEIPEYMRYLNNDGFDIGFERLDTRTDDYNNLYQIPIEPQIWKLPSDKSKNNEEIYILLTDQTGIKRDKDDIDKSTDIIPILDRKAKRIGFYTQDDLNKKPEELEGMLETVPIKEIKNHINTYLTDNGYL